MCGLTAGTLFESLTSSYASAQPAPKAVASRRPQRVAVIGAGHYHATLAPYYLKILQNEKLDIVGVHDPDRRIAADRAKRCGSTPYTDYRAMIEKTKPEFVLSLGRHVNMPAAFRFLVDSGIPFLAEKPWGVDDKTVNELADYAEKKRPGRPLPCRCATVGGARPPGRWCSAASWERSHTCWSGSTSPAFNATLMKATRGC